MPLNPQFPTELVTFIEEILNGKLHFLCHLWQEKPGNVLFLTAYYEIDVTAKSFRALYND